MQCGVFSELLTVIRPPSHKFKSAPCASAWPGAGAKSCQCGFLAERSQLVPQSSFVNWQNNKVATWLVNKKGKQMQNWFLLFSDDLHVCWHILPEIFEECCCTGLGWAFCFAGLLQSIPALLAFVEHLCSPCTPQTHPPLTVPTAAAVDQLEMVQLNRSCAAGQGWLKCWLKGVSQLYCALGMLFRHLMGSRRGEIALLPCPNNSQMQKY